jgi:hypothetical protein
VTDQTYYVYLVSVILIIVDDGSKISPTKLKSNKQIKPITTFNHIILPPSYFTVKSEEEKTTNLHSYT